jgi:hypothetical protein
VGKRFDIKIAVLFMGAAQVKEVGPQHLTMNADEAVTAAKYFKDALIVPLHFEGWEHFREPGVVIKNKFDEAGLSHRLRWAI